MSFADAFVDQSKIDTTYSDKYLFDARELVCQSRSQGATYFVDMCTSLTPWSVHTASGSSVSVVTIGEGGTNNPAGTSAFQLSSGANTNSYCALNRLLTNVPASNALWAEIALSTVDDCVNDALNISLQSTEDHSVMSLLFYRDHVSVGAADGSYHILSTHSPVYACEDWFENHKLSNGLHAISLWQGTQLISTVTLELPVGPTANDGLLYIGQGSGTHNAQTSLVMGLNLGITQLPDNALVQSKPYALKYDANVINLLLKVEDVCGDVILNTDFTVDIVIGGVSSRPLMAEVTSVGKGIIDFTKPVRFFILRQEAIMPQGTTVVYKAHMLNGKFMALLHASFEAVSVY